MGRRNRHGPRGYMPPPMAYGPYNTYGSPQMHGHPVMPPAYTPQPNFNGQDMYFQGAAYPFYQPHIPVGPHMMHNLPMYSPQAYQVNPASQAALTLLQSQQPYHLPVSHSYQPSLAPCPESSVKNPANTPAYSTTAQVPSTISMNSKHGDSDATKRYPPVTATITSSVEVDRALPLSNAKSAKVNIVILCRMLWDHCSVHSAMFLFLSVLAESNCITKRCWGLRRLKCIQLL
jgi:hypothetical protein